MKEKMAKCAYYVRGFVKMSTMVILLILLATYYFYQDKIKEVSGQFIQDNRQSGALFYAEGIWNKMKGVQKIQDDRAQNTMDLLSAKKTIADKNGNYSLDVSQNWNVTNQQGVAGGQISKIVVSNDTFSQRIDSGDIFYDGGAQLTVTAAQGEQADAKRSDGGHGKMLLAKKEIRIDGENGTYHKITDPKVKAGSIIDVHVLHDGNTYEMRFVYNGDKFNGGEYVFDEILNSFKFKDNK